MKCFRCNTDNIASLSHCEKCGAPLRVRRHTDQFRKRKIIIVFFVLCFWAAGFTFFFKDVLFWKQGTHVELTEAERSELERAKLEKRKQLADRLRTVMAADQAQADQESHGAGDGEAVSQIEAEGAAVEKEIVAGWTSIFDPWSRQVTRFRSAASAGGWVAIPSRASLAGNKWLFYADFGRETPLEKGLWSRGDSVGLWFKSGEKKPVGAQLVTWNQQTPVDWISIESQKNKHEIVLAVVSQQQPFILCSLPVEVDEIGVLVQGNDIVGWTFGQWLTNAFLWNGPPGKELTPQQTIQSFYDDTFAGGREEKFASALSLGERARAEDRLLAFVDGFRLEPKLRPVDTPIYLQPAEIVKQIRILSSQLIYGGQGEVVAKILDSTILQVIADVSLFMDIVPAITASKGYELAIYEIETTGRAIVENLGINVPSLNEVHVTLYQEWLQSLVTVGAVGEGNAIFDKAYAFYPDDPYLHLLGTELMLLQKDWQRAEEFLYSRDYPQEFQDRFQLLAKRISEMKGDDGKIVIRFSAGASKIPVTAALNESLLQNFLVDTGASYVTIPSSSAATLGVEVVEGHHGGQHMVSTAGGVVAASEVVLDAIEIGGWIEYNVPALILDIPDQPGVGLLGLNYLTRFRMDLNTNEGVLLLSPR